MKNRTAAFIIFLSLCGSLFFPYRIHANQQPSDDIIFFGDSLTAMVNWQRAFPGIPIINAGLSGETTVTAHKRLQQILQKHTPKAIFIMLGINDFLHQPPFHVPSRIDSFLSRRIPAATPFCKGSVNIGNTLYWSVKTIPRTVHAYAALLNQIKTQSPKTRIFVQSVLPTHKDIFYKYYHFQINSRIIQRLNHALKQLAEQEHVTFIDLSPSFIKNGSLDPAFTGDGVHLNASGNTAWREAIKDYVP